MEIIVFSNDGPLTNTEQMDSY